MPSRLLSLMIGALVCLAGTVLHAQSDIYMSTFLMLDSDGWELHGYDAMISTYEVQFYYDVLTDAVLLQADGKQLGSSSANSSDDEYVIAELNAQPEAGMTIQIRTSHGVAPFFRDRGSRRYDAFNFQNVPKSSGVPINYVHYFGRGPANYISSHYIETDESNLREEANRSLGIPAIEVQKGKAWTGGGSVVLDKVPTTLTELKAKGISERDRFYWTVGPKLKVVGSSKKRAISVRGTSLSNNSGDTSVSLSFGSRKGQKQTVSIAFTVRTPVSLARFGVSSAIK
jgi:hypothetical protein